MTINCIHKNSITKKCERIGICQFKNQFGICMKKSFEETKKPINKIDIKKDVENKKIVITIEII